MYLAGEHSKGRQPCEITSSDRSLPHRVRGKEGGRGGRRINSGDEKIGNPSFTGETGGPRSPANVPSIRTWPTKTIWSRGMEFFELSTMLFWQNRGYWQKVQVSWLFLHEYTSNRERFQQEDLFRFCYPLAANGGGSVSAICFFGLFFS